MNASWSAVTSAKNIRRFTPSSGVNSARLKEYSVRKGWHTYISSLENAEMLFAFTAFTFMSIYPGTA